MVFVAVYNVIRIHTYRKIHIPIWTEMGDRGRRVLVNPGPLAWEAWTLNHWTTLPTPETILISPLKMSQLACSFMLLRLCVCSGECMRQCTWRTERDISIRSLPWQSRQHSSLLRLLASPLQWGLYYRNWCSVWWRHRLMMVTTFRALFILKVPFPTECFKNSFFGIPSSTGGRMFVNVSSELLISQSLGSLRWEQGAAVLSSRVSRWWYWRGTVVP